MAFFNPFCSQEAISNSNYCVLKQNKYASSTTESKRLKLATNKVAHKLLSIVEELDELQVETDPEEPLAAAVADTVTKTQKSRTFGVYTQLGSPEATAGLCRDLVQFLHELKEGLGQYKTYMAVFVTPSKFSQDEFHNRVAQQMALLQKAAEPFYCLPETDAEVLNKGDHLIAFGGRVLKVTSIYRNSSGGHLKFDYPMLAFSLYQKPSNSGNQES